MNLLISAALFGILGAVVRTAADFLKCNILKEKITSQGIIFYAFSVVAIGAFLGIVLDYGWAVSFIGGYAGQDVLEGLYQAIKKVKVSFK